MAKRNNLEKLFRGLIYILPGVLFFSYYPIITWGSNESMNFEFSVPLLWLVLFDVVGVGMMIKQKTLLRDLKKNWVWLLFPVWLTISVCWSSNFLRGLLVAGILWLIYLAIYLMYELREAFKEEKTQERFWQWFFGATVLACAWCVVQCGLDISGVSHEYTLMCAGCTYHSFGFPHPNGMAVEPQFMGNLLLAPTMIAAWWCMKNRHKDKTSKNSLRWFLLLAIFAATLFLTFSRGAIYAFMVGMMFITGYEMAKEKKNWKTKVGQLGKVWMTIGLAFLFTLNLQGIMAAISPTNDNYKSGVAKVLNHLSLGVIDLREDKVNLEREKEELAGGNEEKVFVENSVEKTGEKAVFDGYVAESTDTRLKLSNAAMEVWAKDFSTVMFGVGLGGAGQALYVNGLTSSPKEIIQNEYVSLLLETGVIGILLLLLTLGLIVKKTIKKSTGEIILALAVAYGISLCFFAGLPNALHIYLLFGGVCVMGFLKKLVS